MMLCLPVRHLHVFGIVPSLSWEHISASRLCSLKWPILKQTLLWDSPLFLGKILSRFDSLLVHQAYEVHTCSLFGVHMLPETCMAFPCLWLFLLLKLVDPLLSGFHVDSIPLMAKFVLLLIILALDFLDIVSLDTFIFKPCLSVNILTLQLVSISFGILL